MVIQVYGVSLCFGDVLLPVCYKLRTLLHVFFSPHNSDQFLPGHACSLLQFFGLLSFLFCPEFCFLGFLFLLLLSFLTVFFLLLGFPGCSSFCLILRILLFPRFLWLGLLVLFIFLVPELLDHLFTIFPATLCPLDSCFGVGLGWLLEGVSFWPGSDFFFFWSGLSGLG